MSKRFSKRPVGENNVEADSSEDANPRELLGRGAAPSVDRKTLQLCRQVERTISLVLSGELDDDRVRDLMVMSVVPAPHSSHLLVTVQSSEVLSPEQLLEVDAALSSFRGRLRTAVAESINRRKAPDMSFRIVNP
jgi:ribosome-binding factor A